MSSRISLPVIPNVWAYGGGGTRSILETDAGTNQTSYQKGFPELTATPVVDGGIPPNRLDMNAILQLITTYLMAIQNGQYLTFDSSVSSKIGGYPRGAVLWHLTNGVPDYMVASLVDNNTQSNLANTSYWKKLNIMPSGDAMSGLLSDVNSAQIRNIQFVNSESDTGTNGVIYAIKES